MLLTDRIDRGCWAQLRYRDRCLSGGGGGGEGEAGSGDAREDEAPASNAYKYNIYSCDEQKRKEERSTRKFPLSRGVRWRRAVPPGVVTAISVMAVADANKNKNKEHKVVNRDMNTIMK